MTLISHPSISTIREILAAAFDSGKGLVVVPLSMTGGLPVVDLSVAAQLGAGDAAVIAAREGRAVHGDVDDITPGSAMIVLTNASLVFNIPERYIFFLTLIQVGIRTANDSCEFEIGYTTAINGGGTFTPVESRLHIATGTAASDKTPVNFELNPPIPIRYSDGARSITFRVDANDTGAQIDASFHGWIEST